MSSNRYYTRFVPREELGEVRPWEFGSVNGPGIGLLGPLLPEAVAAPLPEPLPEALPGIELDEHEALLQQAHEQAYAQGLAQGQAQGQESERLQWQQRMDDYVAGQGREVAEQLAQLTQAFEASLSGLQQSMAQELLQLACDLARQVLRTEIQVNRQALLPVVREALSMLVGENRPATVRLNPEDWSQLEPALREQHASPRIEWLPDAAVQPGECQVESAGMAVDGSLDKRWQRAIAALGLTDAWREVRHDD